MANLRLLGSVGVAGKNNPNDIKAVQAALNNLLKMISITQPLTVDGRLGSRPENSKTVAAIQVFQKKVVGMIRPDGKIDTNGKTHRKINEKIIINHFYMLPTTQGAKSRLSENDFSEVAKKLDANQRL